MKQVAFIRVGWFLLAGAVLAADPGFAAESQIRPVSRAEKVWRWCRRKPALAASFLLILILLVILIAGSPIALYRINQARKSEQAQLQRAEAGELKARQFAYASDMNLAHQAVQEDDFYRALQLLERHRPSMLLDEEDATAIAAYLTRSRDGAFEAAAPAGW